MSDAAATPAPVEEKPVAPKEYPGQTLGIVALVFAFVMQVPALAMGIIAWQWSKRAGVNNNPAKAAVWVSIAFMVLGIVLIVGWLVFIASLATQLGEFGPMGPGDRFWD